MHKSMILSAAFALGAVTVLPATQALNIGGEAQAQRGGDGQRAGNRQGRRNGERRRTGNRNGQRAGNRNGNRSAAREPRREVTNTAPPRREARNRTERRVPRLDRFRRWRQRDRFARRDVRRTHREFRRERFGGRRARRGFHANHSCMRPRRIRRRLHRQGWDVVAFHRAGRRFNVRARSRRGVLHALRVDACNGHIISAHGLERKRHRGIKRAFRKIGRTFKKIF
ncbi:MAG: hypothetical protein ACR2PI_10520 [Hyphomicrobiaceae bacterium]